MDGRIQHPSGRAAALRQGVPVEKLDALEEPATSPLFTPAEQAALDLAKAMTRDVHVSDAVFNRVNGALGIESQGLCELPPRAPRARSRAVA